MTAAAAGSHSTSPSSGPSPERLHGNQQQTGFYAAGLCGFLAILIMAHWVRPSVTVMRHTRHIRSLLVQKVPGFPSLGHALVVAAFVGLNVAVGFTNIDPSSLSNYASRFGWMSLGNMCLLVFLALKNTPVAFLANYSYERIQYFHQVTGYCLVVWTVLHAALYTYFFSSIHILETIFALRSSQFGIVAGFGFLTALVAALVLRRFWYEWFYVVHVAGWVVSIVAVAWHQPEAETRVTVAVGVAAGLWLLDRLIRGTRMLWNRVNNTATLHPLADGVTKIVVAKAPWGAQPGQHGYLWIPSIRRFETHPFTMVSTRPHLEMAVQARNGFTRALYEFARAHPGVSLGAAVDGPYGTLPDPSALDKVILVAGGSGVTFTLGLAETILARWSGGDGTGEKHMTLIWAVPKQDHLSWFDQDLDKLKTHATAAAHAAKVDVDVYVTRESSAHNRATPPALVGTTPFNESSSPSLSPSPSSSSSSSSPPPTTTHRASSPSPSPSAETPDSDPEKTAILSALAQASCRRRPVPPGLRHRISHTRPDVASLLRSAVHGMPKNQRVWIAACGPAGMMAVTRDTVAQFMAGDDGPAVTLHCEAFGW